jgi:hypothetical protein
MYFLIPALFAAFFKTLATLVGECRFLPLQKDIPLQ